MRTAFSIALSYVVNIFFKPTAEEIRSGGEKWAGIYVAIGVGCLLAGMVQVILISQINAIKNLFFFHDQKSTIYNVID